MTLIRNGAWMPQLRQMAVSEYDGSAAPAAFDAIAAGEKKHGRLVSVVACKSNLDVSAWDANDATAWQALITSSDIHVLGPVTGQVPEPSESTSPGDGHLEEISDGEQYDIPFSFYNPDDNFALGESLNKQSQQGTWSVMVVFYDMTGWIFTTNGINLVPVKYRFRAASQGEEIPNNRRMLCNVKFRVSTLPKVLTDLPTAVFKKN